MAHLLFPLSRKEWWEVFISISTPIDGNGERGNNNNNNIRTWQKEEKNKESEIKTTTWWCATTMSLSFQCDTDSVLCFFVLFFSTVWAITRRNIYLDVIAKMVLIAAAIYGIAAYTAANVGNMNYYAWCTALVSGFWSGCCRCRVDCRRWAIEGWARRPRPAMTAGPPFRSSSTAVIARNNGAIASCLQDARLARWSIAFRIQTNNYTFTDIFYLKMK